MTMTVMVCFTMRKHKAYRNVRLFNIKCQKDINYVTFSQYPYFYSIIFYQIINQNSDPRMLNIMKLFLDILNCMINDHNCSQLCVELEGLFNCSCYSGYELQQDRATCEGN